jgi:cytochrome c-type biogenesis protein CcmH/NrfG
MFSSDITESIKSIVASAKVFAKSNDPEVQKKAIKLLEKALAMLEEEM